jgi:acyl-CoA dehydrogenase
MSETATIVAQMVDRLFADHVDEALLVASDAGNWPQALWTLVQRQGLPAALVPEEQGGMGASFGEAFVIARACGFHRVPLPLPETIAAGWLLTGAKLKMPVAPLSLGGAQENDDVRIEQFGADWRLTASLHRVPWGRVAQAVVVAVKHQGTTLIVCAPRQGAAIECAANVAGEFRDTLVFHDHPVEVGSWPHGFVHDPVIAIGAMMRAAQMAGALSAILGRSVSYANERHQFGRPIGKLQAIQQNLALLAGEAAAAAVAAEAAFLAADDGSMEFAVAAAKVRAGLAVSQAVGIAHQVHGAIGFTLEHSLHWSTRRLMSWRNEFGSDRHWSVILGRSILNLGADGFWPHITAA